MKIIFLSAGRGARMFPLTEDVPKPLLDIGDGVSIIDSQLKSISDCGGIDEVVFVVGYKAEMIEKRLEKYTKTKVRFLYNPFYMTSNNLISLWLARGEMDSDFIIINGDNVFKPDVLKRLLAEPKKKEIVMVVDQKKRYSTEDMKVVMEKDRVVKVSKKIPAPKANGESIGMMRLIGEGRNVLRSTLDRMVRQEENKQIFYLEAFQQIMNSGFPVYPNLCAVEEWSEIDFHPDLELIRQNAIHFFPGGRA